MVSRARLLVAALAVFALVGCREDAPHRPMVFAAASLGGVLDPLGERWAKGGHPPPRFTYDSTSRLAQQIASGAPADLFVSADVAWMDELSETARILPQSRVDLLSNALVLVVARPGPACPDDLAGLTAPAYRRIGVGGEAVPVGRYARQALAGRQVLTSLDPRLISLPNARALLAAVEAGELDAALLYRTDAARARSIEVCLTVEGQGAPVIRYQAALVTGHHAGAEELLAWVQGEEAWTVYEEAGFIRPR